jgi:hypothetical protein
MLKSIGCLILTFALAGSVVHAADTDQGMTSQAQASAGEGRKVYESPLNISPAVGVLGFQDGAGSYTSRLSEGLMVNWNIAGLIPDLKGANLGVEVGLAHSHVGAPSSNFIGRNASSGGITGANAFLIPINATLGAKFGRGYTDLHFGMDALYRSVANSMNVGRGDGTNASSTDLFPDVGITLGWEATRVIGVTVRGDYIPTPGNDMFSATLGATFPLA